MFLKKIQYKISKFMQAFLLRFRGMDLNLGYCFFSFICIVSIVLLGTNIFRIIKKGYERYEIIQMEKRRLEELALRNLELKEDLKYYSSKEYIDLKAREELNLAFPNQRLVRIDREEVLGIEDERDDEGKQITPSWRLWYDLLF